jgi:alpha-mannosidase
MTVEAIKQKGSLPSRSSFVRLTPEPLVLTTIKKAEGSSAWVLQWYNPAGEDLDAVLELPRVPREAVLSNFLEEDGAPATIAGAAIHVKTKARSVVTIKCTF